MIWRFQKTTELTRGVGKANNHFVISVKDMRPEVMTSRIQQAVTLELELQWEAIAGVKNNIKLASVAIILKW